MIDNKFLIAGVVVLVLALGFVFLGSASIGTGNSQQSQASPEDSKGEVKEFEVLAYQWSFSPSEIRVKKGDRVRLKVKSTDVPHGLAIPQYGINEYLEPGKEEVVEFIADQSGTAQGVCSIYCGVGHRNMVLNIIVE